MRLDPFSPEAEERARAEWREIQRLMDVVCPGAERISVALTGGPPVLPPNERPSLAVVESPGRVRTSKRRASLTVVGKADDHA